MEYINAQELSEKWGISSKAVRNYCRGGRIPGAYLEGNTWMIPKDSKKPIRKKRNDASSNSRTLLNVLRSEKKNKISGSIYHLLQIEFTYNSNHIEGSTLSHDETRLIFETKTIGYEGPVNIHDAIEANNHFRCIDFIIDNCEKELTENFIKNLHRILKSGADDINQDYCIIGDYKKYQNYVGNIVTSTPEEVSIHIKQLLKEYRADVPTLDSILDFHARFEKIHPFYDGNGRVGRLIMLKECLKYGIIPFMITEDLKPFYIRGIYEWQSGHERGYLRDTCLTAQDKMAQILKKFEVAPMKDGKVTETSI